MKEIDYLPKSYLWTKNERNWFSNSSHEIKILIYFYWPSLLIKNMCATDSEAIWACDQAMSVTDFIY